MEVEFILLAYLFLFPLGISMSLYFLFYHLIENNAIKEVTVTAAINPFSPKNYKKMLEDIKLCPEKIKNFCATEAAAANRDIEEQLWKKRVLMEYDKKRNTLILMNYDLYREAFTYYCDLQSISYETLNKIAQKYVILYGCVDFYHDEIPPLSSPEDEKIPTEKPPADNSCWVKPKTEIKLTTNLPPIIEIKNKFIRVGKVCDFKFLSSMEKKTQ